ncbi:fms-related tyrosine kinase 3 ligand isoform X2 [Phalacrocorax carbo]|uniref:fms-related tyrosine kinase 3 ligand isoform X2 n=1 Tax=Phalacrocorax carbo TaxID=9209 RepID=UPI0031196085
MGVGGGFRTPGSPPTPRRLGPHPGRLGPLERGWGCWRWGGGAGTPGSLRVLGKGGGEAPGRLGPTPDAWVPPGRLGPPFPPPPGCPGPAEPGRRFHFRRRLRCGTGGVLGGSRVPTQPPTLRPAPPQLGPAMDPAPGSFLVPLLLLLDVSCPSGCCSFEFNPISSTFRSHVDDLSSWLILDYPVAMPSNLEMDSHCSDLWGLHFVAAALRRMAGVAGVALAPQLQAVATHITFVTECHIHDPQDCVRLETVNVSQLLGSLVQHLGGLQGRPLHFPGCARLRCRPGPPLTTPAGQHEGTLGSRLGPPGIHGPVLLGGLGGALALAAVAWVLWRRPCAQPLQETPVSEQDGT